MDVGFVDGTTAATTPNGSAISIDAAVLVPGDDTDRLHRTDEVVDLLRREEILLDLVFDDAVAGFFDGQAGKGFGLGRGRGGHRVDDRVDTFLAEFRELSQRLFGAARQCTRFGNRSQVAIRLLWDGFCH